MRRTLAAPGLAAVLGMALLLTACGKTNAHNNTAGSLGGSIAGATAGNVAGRAGRLIKTIEFYHALGFETALRTVNGT